MRLAYESLFFFTLPPAIQIRSGMFMMGCTVNAPFLCLDLYPQGQPPRNLLLFFGEWPKMAAEPRVVQVV